MNANVKTSKVLIFLFVKNIVTLTESYYNKIMGASPFITQRLEL